MLARELAAVAALIGAAAQQAPPITTTVCALDGDPKAFEGKRVALVALLEPDGHSGWRLRDRACLYDAVVLRAVEERRGALEALSKGPYLIAVTVTGTARSFRQEDGGFYRAGLVIEAIGSR